MVVVAEFLFFYYGNFFGMGFVLGISPNQGVIMKEQSEHIK